MALGTNIAILSAGAFLGLYIFAGIRYFLSGIDTRNDEYKIMENITTSIFFDKIRYDTENERYKLFRNGTLVAMVKDRELYNGCKFQNELKELRKRGENNG